MQRFLFAVLIVFLCAFSPTAFALRCGSSVVNQGLQDFQVRARCGDPFWATSYLAVDVLGVDGPIERQSEVQYDIWYYNFGPRALMRQLVFRDGVLLREETLGYGVRELGEDCEANHDYSGMTAGELVARCGAPAERRSHLDTIVRRPQRGVARYRDQHREDWIYDFGDTRYLRVMRLVDDRVVEVDTLDR